MGHATRRLIHHGLRITTNLRGRSARTAALATKAGVVDMPDDEALVVENRKKGKTAEEVTEILAEAELMSSGMEACTVSEINCLPFSNVLEGYEPLVKVMKVLLIHLSIYGY
ncbi:hypothetical protein BC938DRAFT_472601 [Jimgerdemannia flammicorona]|uniref:Uncharacterized protein n=1 Tax=Jimgerdemannia flammicorona TaxID=994334 RepID=A0A433Q5R3_9FUNG|nr:hypothetical protein BC938DRAFT_472601 [Jimgerdemannia flammicorona]